MMVTGYCVKDKQSVEIKDGVESRTKRGTRILISSPRSPYP